MIPQLRKSSKAVKFWISLSLFDSSLSDFFWFQDHVDTNEDCIEVPIFFYFFPILKLGFCILLYRPKPYKMTDHPIFTTRIHILVFFFFSGMTLI